MTENSHYNKKENKNIKGVFSALCLCIIALGLIVYFSTTRKTPEKDNPVNENQTLQVTTEVHRSVTLRETTTEAKTEKPTEKVTSKKAEKKDSEPVTMEQGDGNTPYKSFYKYPLSEAVIKGYSEELVYDETMGDYRAHAAVDFSGNEDDEVVAVNDGIVIAAYTDNLLGNVVEIDHGAKLVVKYCGLKSMSVRKGSRVNIGNKIGTLGSVPGEAAEGAHLHLEARLDGVSVNPLDVMGKSE